MQPNNSQPNNFQRGNSPLSGILSQLGSPGLSATPGGNAGINSAQTPANAGGGRGLPYKGVSAGGNNPFSDILQGLGRPGIGDKMNNPQLASLAPQQGSTVTGTNPASPNIGYPTPQQQGQEQLTPGKNPGGSKMLLGSLQQMNNFITQSSDPFEIKTARNIITQLTTLMNRDQQKQQSALSQAMQGGGPGQNPLGQGTGGQGTGRNMGLVGAPNKSTVPAIGGFPNASPSTTVNNVTGGAL